MKYQITLTKTEHKIVDVEDDSPEDAVTQAEKDGFKADGVCQLIHQDQPGEEWEVMGKCESCAAPILFPGNHFLDGEGIWSCEKCMESSAQSK